MPSEVDQQILIDAFVRYAQENGRQALKAIWDQALKDSLAGVQVTTVSFEGGSTSSVPNEINTAQLLVIAEQALQIFDDDLTSVRSTTVLFGAHILET